MFADTVAGAIAGVRSHARLNELSQDIWKAYGNGLLTDLEAQRLAERLETRRTEVRELDRTSIRAPSVPRVIGASVFPVKKRHCTSPDRQRSIERRRRLAASGPMPPALACRFTTGELAALRIVADEVRASGSCGLTVGEIAARAGVGITTARGALRAAARDGLLTIEERRRHMAPNLPNLIRIISAEWRTWIARTKTSKGGGFGKAESTDTGELNSVKIQDGSKDSRGIRRRGGEIERHARSWRDRWGK
jgi:DNA-binding transcriptional ArsR family regulator